MQIKYFITYMNGVFFRIENYFPYAIYLIFISSFCNCWIIYCKAIIFMFCDRNTKQIIFKGLHISHALIATEVCKAKHCRRYRNIIRGLEAVIIQLYCPNPNSTFRET